MILINFASKLRPEKFHFCMDNIAECFTDYNVLAKVDNDDPKLKRYLSRPYPEAQFEISPSKSKVHAINKAIPDGWDILVNTSDDILWHRHAGKIIKEQMEKDTFLHFPETYAEGQAKISGRASISVCSIMDKTYYDRFGYIYYPAYVSLWCDDEATRVARKLGRYKFVNEYIFEHHHPAAGFGAKDKLLLHTESFFKADKQTYLKRKEINFGL